MAPQRDITEASGRSPSRGKCYLYIVPSAYEDLLKVGFSRDPLVRLQSLHPRYFEVFDLDRALAVEADTVREARAMELMLRRKFVLHNAPAPLTVQRKAGGHTEWYRGAYKHLSQAAADFAAQGHTLHEPLRPILRQALWECKDLLFAWAEILLSQDDLDTPRLVLPSHSMVRDVLDSYAAMNINIEPLVSDDVLRWYGR